MGRLVRPPDGCARALQHHRHLLLHARSSRYPAASHQPAARAGAVRRFLWADDRTLRTPHRTKGRRRMSLHDPKRTDVNVALVGIGNCASSLVQGIAHYSNGGANEQIGLSHWDLGGYRPKDLKGVAAGGIDRPKGGREGAGGVFAPPKRTRTFCDPVGGTRTPRPVG